MTETPEVFYVKTQDQTTFAIYDLTLSDDCDKISFGYNFIEDSPKLDKSHYEEELDMIVRQQVERAIKLEVANANLRENT